jgi:hypothetical protein
MGNRQQHSGLPIAVQFHVPGGGAGGKLNYVSSPPGSPPIPLRVESEQAEFSSMRMSSRLQGMSSEFPDTIAGHRGAMNPSGSLNGR